MTPKRLQVSASSRRSVAYKAYKPTNPGDWHLRSVRWLVIDPLPVHHWRQDFGSTRLQILKSLGKRHGNIGLYTLTWPSLRIHGVIELCVALPVPELRRHTPSCQQSSRLVQVASRLILEATGAISAVSTVSPQRQAWHNSERTCQHYTTFEPSIEYCECSRRRSHVSFYSGCKVSQECISACNVQHNWRLLPEIRDANCKSDLHEPHKTL
jgi:hypothetical protein